MKLGSIFVLISAILIRDTLSQSNYASHANNVGYLGEGLPEEATLDGKVTKLDDLSPIIFLNRTKAALNCAAGSMQIEMKFNEPFFGLAYADFDRNSACQILGKGELSYRLELPLKGCGTKQEPQRVFTNNIVVRFHPGLEMDGDEIITIVCRYPPPITPPPAALPAPLIPLHIGSVEPPLKGAQILFFICAILFLTLLLLGLGVSYYCLSRRTIPVVRRLPMSMGSGSEITKLSGSSLGMPPFEGIKIPRAHPIVAATHSSSSSDDNPLISDTLPSDYPSESISEIEVDTRSLPASSAGSYENQAYIRDNSSIYSENYGHTQEFQEANAVAQPIYATRHPIAMKEPSPLFDVQMRVRRAPSLPASSTYSSDTESFVPSTPDVPRNNLSTIMESHEDRESVITIDSLPRDVAHSQFTYVPELHTPPRHAPPPNVFKNIERYQETIDEEHWPEDYTVDGPRPHSPKPSTIISTATERNDIRSMTEIVDTTHLYPRQPPYQTAEEIDYVEAPPEPPIVVRKPEVTSHLVDDVFLRTITEKTTLEDIEKYKRKVTEYKAKPGPIPPSPTWDVTIRNYPEERPQWEDFSDVSSISAIPSPPRVEPKEPQTFIDENGVKLTSPELVGNMKPIEIPPEDKDVPNWDVLIRVLEETTEILPPPRPTTTATLPTRATSGPQPTTTASYPTRATSGPQPTTTTSYPTRASSGPQPTTTASYPTRATSGPQPTTTTSYPTRATSAPQPTTTASYPTRATSGPQPTTTTSYPTRATSGPPPGPTTTTVSYPTRATSGPQPGPTTTTVSYPTRATSGPQPGPTTTTTTTTTVTETNVIDDTTTVTQHTTTDNTYNLQRQISYEDKLKWRDIITTESTLRTMLKEAVVREDFERIRSDTRYETLFEPQTWDVIIRILAPPEPEPEEVVPRRKKKEPWDTRSRRSSLPTLYEYDSDGGSSVRTIPQEYLPIGSSNTYQYPPHSRRTSRSSYNAENIDMRSMSEVIVDFGRPDNLDNVSDVSSFYPNRYYDDDPYDRRSIQRSLSQPSLARSATEITERWVIPDDMSDDSSERPNRLTSFRPHPQRPGQVITERQYVQESSSFQATNTSSPPKDWYTDNRK